MLAARVATEVFADRLASEGLATLRRGPVRTLQVNVTRRCNFACHHCHVESGPQRSEALDRPGAERVLELLNANPQVEVLDLTGGAPELSEHFQPLVEGARALGRRVLRRMSRTAFSADSFLAMDSFSSRSPEPSLISLARLVQPRLTAHTPALDRGPTG